MPLKPIIVALFIAAVLPAAAQKNAPHSPQSTDSVVTLSGAENPQFRGGQEALAKYFAKHLNYPERARSKNIQGDVVIGFLIDEKGNLSNVRVVKSLDKSCDLEALRVVKEMPHWQPAKVNNKAVATEMLLPVSFRINKALIIENNSKIKNKYR